MDRLGGAIAAHYPYVDTVAQWLAAHGVARDVAARYVTSIFAGVGAALARLDADPHALSHAHMTPGGINEQFASMLAAAGVSDVIDESLDQVLDRLRAGT